MKPGDAACRPFTPQTPPRRSGSFIRPPIRLPAAAPNSTVAFRSLNSQLSTLNSLPGSSHPRYQPSTPQPSTKLRYRSKKIVRVMVRVAPHKTPVVIGLVHWYGYLPRYAPPPGSLLSTINFRLSTPPHLTKTEQNGLKRTSISTTPPGKLEQASASVGKRWQA